MTKDLRAGAFRRAKAKKPVRNAPALQTLYLTFPNFGKPCQNLVSA